MFLDVMGAATPRVVFFEGADRLDELADLYGELHTHHVGVAPHLGHLPPRTPGESWTRRRRQYEQWLAVPGAFVALATNEAQSEVPRGYALVTLAAGYQGWTSGPRVGEIKDLVIRSDARRRGVGSALLEAVEARLANIGVREYRVSVIAPNEDAVAFYESRGLTLVSHVFLGRVGAGSERRG